VTWLDDVKYWIARSKLRLTGWIYRDLANRNNILERDNQQLLIELGECEKRYTSVYKLFIEAQDECVDLRRQLKKIREFAAGIQGLDDD